jgi:hypothetical protein
MPSTTAVLAVESDSNSSELGPETVTLPDMVTAMTQSGNFEGQGAVVVGPGETVVGLTSGLSPLESESSSLPHPNKVQERINPNNKTINRLRSAFLLLANMAEMVLLLRARLEKRRF